MSTEQVTRAELTAMNERLDQQLVYRQSQRNARYCPIRFGLHMELFGKINIFIICINNIYFA